MKKLILMAVALIVLTADCFAARVINSDRAALGGVTIGSKFEYVEGIYGSPTMSRRNADGHSIDWFYGDTFQIRFVDGRATFISSSGNNGLNTPDGIGVGMAARSVTKALGRPSERLKFDGRVIYVYNGAGAWQMLFIINNNQITEIRLISRN